jgi:hypothetical protein
VRALEKQLRTAKVKRIDTAVVTDNEGAARFYAQMVQRAGGGEAGEGVVNGKSIAESLLASRTSCKL